MMVICLIQVVAMHFVSKATVEGKVLYKNDSNYVVNFSEDTKKRGFDGDYSKVIVDKRDCVEEK